ncbi:ead/Ea22-like family protein [Enterobacter kobei]|nr:ead/Ea22-like family protein [Enterobacter kobei]
MSNIDKQALREAAEKATESDWIVDAHEGWHAVIPVADAVNGNYIIAEFQGPESKRNRDFVAAANPVTFLALLDELEAKDAQIANLTAERDALREGEMGDAKHSNTRAAADIYFQLVEECEIPPGGSLVEYVIDLRERAAAAGKGE